MGTTGIAALIHSRRFSGCDYVKEYVDAANERISYALNNTKFTFRHIGTPIESASTGCRHSFPWEGA